MGMIGLVGEPAAAEVLTGAYFPGLRSLTCVLAVIGQFLKEMIGANPQA